MIAQLKRNRKMDSLAKDGIHQLFVRPMLQQCPDGVDEHQWLEHLFGAGQREILEVEVRQPFEMPGLFYQTARKKVQGAGDREVEAGDLVFVRTDSYLTPKFLDLELVSSKRSSGDRMFQLTVSDFEQIQPYLGAL